MALSSLPTMIMISDKVLSFDGEIDLDSHTNGFYFPNLAEIRHAHGCTRNPVAFFYSL